MMRIKHTSNICSFVAASLALVAISIQANETSAPSEKEQLTNRQSSQECRLFGRFVKEDPGNERQVVESINRRLMVRKEGVPLREGIIIESNNGCFTCKGLRSGHKYTVSLMPDKDVQYVGLWTIEIPHNTKQCQKEFLVNDGWEKQHLRLILKYDQGGPIVSGANIVLYMFCGDYTYSSTRRNTDREGTIDYSIWYHPDCEYQFAIDGCHSGLEENADSKNDWELKYPKLDPRNYQTDRFSIADIGETYVWQLHAMEKSIVVNVQGELPVGRRSPEIDLWRDLAQLPNGFFRGVRSKDGPNDTVVKEFWSFDLDGDKARFMQVVLGKSGALQKVSREDYYPVRSARDANLYRVRKGLWRAIFYDLSPGTYYGLRLRDTSEVVVPDFSEPIQITNDSELPVLVNTELKPLGTPKRITFKGLVKDMRGNPVAGAVVRCYGRGKQISGETGTDGTMEFSGTKPGIYLITSIYPGGKTNAVVRRLQAGQNRVVFSYNMPPSFSGRIMDAAGNPIPYAGVEAVPLSGPESRRIAITASENGSYEIPVPKDGAIYAVAAEAAVSNTQDGWHIYFLEKKVNGPGTKLDITLPDTVRINGKIIVPDALRNRIENSGVVAIKSMRYGSLSMPEAKTSDQFEFVLDLVPGRYNLFFSGALLQGRGKRPKHPIVPLGVLDVPDDEAEVVYEKNLTKSMFQEAWTLKEFRRRIEEARSEVGQAVDN